MGKTIVLTGGGTAGHVTPHFVLLDELKKHYSKIIYIGSNDGIEKELIKNNTNLEYYGIDCVKLVRKKILKNLLLPFRLMRAKKQAEKILKEIKPNVIFSKGGFVSVPVVLAASALKIPVVCHESDLSMGLANKICSRHAKKVCTTFELTAKVAKSKGVNAVFTGSPVLKNKITDTDLTMLKNQMQIPANTKILLVTGGSQGSQAINAAVAAGLNQLTKDFFVIHVTGKGNLHKDITNKNYKQIEYANNMPELIKLSDVVISRAGSNTIFELAFAQKPMLLIPLPKGTSRGDQVENAKYFNDCGFAKVLHQADLTPETLARAVKETFKARAELISSIKKSHLTSGTEKILKEIYENSTC